MEITKTEKLYTSADAMLEAFKEMGVSYIFGNFGSDHPAIIESLAHFKQQGISMPEVIICQHEMVALSAAHGYAQVTGEPQAVIIHVDCGTQNLGGAVHNAAKGRIPVIIFAGMSPLTQEGELPGSRNEYIHWLQDAHDQSGIVRNYAKHAYEIRTGKNIKQVMHRAKQLAVSDPQGPVYLTAAREVLEESSEPVSLNHSKWKGLAPQAVAKEKLNDIIEKLTAAERPLIVTSYIGRQEESVHELVKLAEALSIPVLESAPSRMNFPAEHPLHVGYRWNESFEDPYVTTADVILVIDSDVPWIPLTNRPQKEADIYYIDMDPLKETTPLWYFPSNEFIKADSLVFLKQLNEQIARIELNYDRITARHEAVMKHHETTRETWKQKEVVSNDGRITPELLSAKLREALDDDAIVMSEAITNFTTVNQHIPRSLPGSYYSLGASSLGWNGGAAVGAKLASPNRLVVSLTGDGSYVFSNPTPVHWMSRKYDAPFLTVIFNNEQWNAPKFSTLGVHPEGVAHETNQFWTMFDPSSNLSGVAEAAGGAYAVCVNDADELSQALTEAINVVKGGRSAVVDVRVTGR
ncbi:thiamine pyrophosphate-requiring protein [Geomicrobium sp. JCM 19039]|uniref:thiamine pyrophosphate-requiring protein n=1 Tax=Geomicrobium sp. JCM 19039 TaxID=1460636 RepID=UPI00045F30B0|nr:thiamine pyrophosphate-requiring protein [Geomicrobium sp. JCM 19039]GAK14262.1 hypothetical protein JCM19039_4165 [Geomicrobium sp. JCM 19039]